MIWPFCPLDGMLEALEYRTDILRARSSEQRIRLTDHPRRVFSAQYVFTPVEYEQARSLIRGTPPAPFWLPEFSEGVFLNVSSGQTVLPVDTRIAQYASAMRLVTVGETLETYAIDSFTDTEVTLATPLSSSGRVLVAPVFAAFCPGGMGVDRTPGVIRASIEWRIYTGGEIPADEDLPTYAGDPLLTHCAEVGSGGAVEGTVREVEMVDNGIAQPFFDDILTEARQTLTMAWMPQTPNIYDLRRFFNAVKGAQKAFYLPCWNKGLTLAAPVTNLATKITLESAGLTAYDKVDIFIRKKDGNLITVGGTPEFDSSGDAIDLTAPFPGALSQDDIDTMCLMFRVRIDADRIEIAHMAGFGARIVIQCMEVPR